MTADITRKALEVIRSGATYAWIPAILIAAMGLWYNISGYNLQVGSKKSRLYVTDVNLSDAYENAIIAFGLIETGQQQISIIDIDFQALSR